jgi:hypothetical protein
MQKFFESKIAFFAILFLFAVAIAIGGVQHSATPIGVSQSPTSNAVRSAHGPSIPPDPWDWNKVQHGPSIPPDPWDWRAANHGPSIPPDPWDWNKVQHGPSIPPDPWDWAKSA